MASPTTTTPTATGQATVVTVTVGASQTADSGGDDTVSSTMSLIYIYSAATTEAQPTASSSSSDSHHLAGGAIAGIVVGCVAFLVLLALGLFCYSRKIARKRRRQRAPSTLHFPPSATPQTLPSRAESRAPTGLHTLAMYSPAMHSPAMNSPAMHSPSMHQQMALLRSDRGGNDSRGDSRGASRTQQYTIATPSPRTPRSNNRHYPKTPPQGMIPELEGSRGHQQPKVHEVYGSYVHPVELQAGSTTNLVAVAEVAEIKKARATEKIVTTSITTMPSSRDKDYSDSASTGYLSPTWPPPPESRGEIGSGGGDTNTVSDMDRTDASTIATDYGKSLQSIHVYFSPGSEYGELGIGSSPTSANFPPELARRQSQIQIALAMSQAASVSSTGSKSRPRGSTMGSSIGKTNWGPNR